MLIAISTPYRRVGLLAQKFKDHYAQNDPDVLFVKGTSKQFNPTISTDTIAAQRQADPVGAVSEWDAEYRTDVSNFLDDDLIEASIDHGRPLELPPSRSFRYKAFIDSSGGRGDAYCVAIGHKRDGRLIIDAVRGKHVPVDSHSFDPMVATKDFADLCLQYGIHTAIGETSTAASGSRRRGASVVCTTSRVSCPNQPSISNAFPYSPVASSASPTIPN